MQKLVNLLREFRIPFQVWKPEMLEILLKQINDRKCRLLIRDHQLVRHVHLVGVKVNCHISETLTLRLVKGQKIPTSTHNSWNMRKLQTVSTKMTCDENPLLVGQRCLQDKVGIRTVQPLVPCGNSLTPILSCDRFHGFHALIEEQQLQLTVPKNKWKPDHTAHRADGSMVHYSWLPMKSSIPDFQFVT